MTMTLLNDKIFGKYEARFPVDNELSIVIGTNGSGKTKLLEALKNYYESQGENVLYFCDTRYLFYSKDKIYEAYQIHLDNIKLRTLFKKDKYDLYSKYNIDIELFCNDLERLERNVNIGFISGYAQLINFFTSIMLSPKPSIVIIDEIERGLSLEFQETILNDILNLSKVKKLIVSTHAPSILSGSWSHAVEVDNCVQLI